MLLSVAERRRAEQFADLLDAGDLTGTNASSGAIFGTVPGPRDAGRGADLAALLATVEAVRRLPVDAGPDPVFRDRLRTRLVAVATVRPAGPGAARPAEQRHEPAPRGWARRRLAALVAAGAAVLVASGVAVASTQALPGGALYGVKLASESVRLQLAGSDLQRGRLLLDFARTRLAEARQVTGDPAATVAALRTMQLQTAQGVRQITGYAATQRDPAVLATVDRFAADQQAGLTQLLSQLTDPAARASAGSALAQLSALAAQTDQLRIQLTAAAGTSSGGGALPGGAGTRAPPTASSPTGATVPTGAAAAGTGSRGAPSTGAGGAAPVPLPSTAPLPLSTGGTGGSLPLPLSSGTGGLLPPTGVTASPVIPTVPVPGVSIQPSLPAVGSAIPLSGALGGGLP